MKVCTLDADMNHFRGLYYAAKKGGVAFDKRFDGTPLKKSRRGTDKLGFVPRREPKGDFPNYSTHIPVFNAGAPAALAGLLEGNGELLPTICDGEECFLYNVTRVVDALDENNCGIERLDSGGILDIERHAFHEKKLRGIPIFKIPQYVPGWVYVTDPFVKRVQETGLRGFAFSLVLSSD